MFCKNGPKLLKINIFLTWHDLFVWKPFCITLFYELFLVKQILNIFNCHCALFYEVLFPFRGSCCVKLTQSYSKSTFLKCFDLIMSGFFGLEDTRRPMDSHSFVRPYVRPPSVSEKSAHEIFLIFFMKPWLYKR